MSDPNMVSITLKEYAQLKDDQAWLRCLDAAGVDNWDGYSEAYAIRREHILDEEGDD